MSRSRSRDRANPRGIGGVDGAALEIDLGWVHAAIGHVGVVRDGEQLVAGLALAVHQEDVAMHVHVVRHRGPLVGAERGELAGLLAFSASATFSFQTVPAISGDISVFTGGPPIRTLTP